MYPFNVEMYIYIHSNVHIHTMNVFSFSLDGPIFKNSNVEYTPQVASVYMPSDPYLHMKIICIPGIIY